MTLPQMDCLILHWEGGSVSGVIWSGRKHAIASRWRRSTGRNTDRNPAAVPRRVSLLWGASRSARSEGSTSSHSPDESSRISFSRARTSTPLDMCLGADVLLAGPMSPADHGAKPVLPRRSKIMLHNGSRSNVAADADRISRRRPRRRPETPIDWSAGPSRLKRPQSESPVSSRGSREWARAVYSSPLRF
jgi:hypothetical protein